MNMQSLAQQDLILSELRHLRNHAGGTQPRDISATNSMFVPGSLFISTLSRYLGGPKHENEQQLSLLRVAIHANITAPSNGNKKSPVYLNLPDDVRFELQQKFILMFYYEEREHRKSNIKSLYDKTFKWIFHDGPLRIKTTFT